ncbi:hypothetical protein NDU88_001793 [Pleurodeles waltl]|uniref:Uncharacterized protein n=1 Tax=Pleurodeles waltl TaxID=8319 RepID=A0AAV7T123_PLEWA|nr:hypothetical protein NDU88_001793 [Pleurodeles waltl]
MQMRPRGEKSNISFTPYARGLVSYSDHQFSESRHVKGGLRFRPPPRRAHWACGVSLRLEKTRVVFRKSHCFLS